MDSAIDVTSTELCFEKNPFTRFTLMPYEMVASSTSPASTNENSPTCARLAEIVSEVATDRRNSTMMRNATADLPITGS